MKIKKLLKPNAFKISVFIFVGIFYLYFAVESICGVSFFFAFCYKAHGFPFPYMVSGDIEAASINIKTSFLGNYFTKQGTFLVNPAVFLLDLVLIYILACFIDILFNKKISKS